MNSDAEIERAMDELFGEGYMKHMAKERVWKEYCKSKGDDAPSDDEFCRFEDETYPTIKKLKEL